jgi:hypothetical protein
MLNQAILPHYRINDPKQQTVGTSSAQMTQQAATDGLKGLPENIFVQALSTNTSPIIISSINPAVSGGVGFELTPGGNLSLPSKNPADWYVISGSAGQKLNITFQGGLE